MSLQCKIRRPHISGSPSFHYDVMQEYQIRMNHRQSIDFSVSRMKISSQSGTRNSQPSVLKRLGEGENATEEVDMGVLSHLLGKKKKKTPFETFIPLAPFLHWSRFAPWSKHTRCPRESGLRLQEASNTEIIKLCNLCQSDMWQMVSHSWLICISWLLKKWNILSKMCRPFEFPLLLLAFFSFPWFDVSALFFILFSVLQTYPSVSCTSYSVLNFFWGAWYFFLGFSHSKISIFLWDSCFYFVVHFV